MSLVPSLFAAIGRIFEVFWTKKFAEFYISLILTALAVLPLILYLVTVQYVSFLSIWIIAFVLFLFFYAPPFVVGFLVGRRLMRIGSDTLDAHSFDILIKRRNVLRMEIWIFLALFVYILLLSLGSTYPASILGDILRASQSNLYIGWLLLYGVDLGVLAQATVIDQLSPTIMARLCLLTALNSADRSHIGYVDRAISFFNIELKGKGFRMKQDLHLSKYFFLHPESGDYAMRDLITRLRQDDDEGFIIEISHILGFEPGDLTEKRSLYRDYVKPWLRFLVPAVLPVAITISLTFAARALHLIP